jgi:hypothetical protein
MHKPKPNFPCTWIHDRHPLPPLHTYKSGRTEFWRMTIQKNSTIKSSETVWFV